MKITMREFLVMLDCTNGIKKLYDETPILEDNEELNLNNYVSYSFEEVEATRRNVLQRAEEVLISNVHPEELLTDGE